MKIAARLQILGAVLLAIAGGLVHLAVGFGVAGVLALVFGVALEREARTKTPEADSEPDAATELEDGEG